MDTEDTETERVIRESEDRESQIQEESEGIAGETFTENDVETETGIEDSYVYDGEVFSEVNEYSARAVTKGKIDYTYWAIHREQVLEIFLRMDVTWIMSAVLC